MQHFVLGHGEFGAEEEILDRVLVQDAMDEQAGFGALEVDAVFLGAIAVQIALLAMQLAEFIRIGFVEVLGQEIEFAQDLELKELRQLRQLGGAAVVEDDLEHHSLLAAKERRGHKNDGQRF